jgi:uncharacterized membrane protein YdjX (TVP38/TMEM64 family)
LQVPVAIRKFSVFTDKRFWLVLLVVALALGIRMSGIGDAFSLDALREHRTILITIVEQNRVLASASYLFLYIAATALSVPGAVLLTLTGGFLFGPLYGAALAVIGASTGATLVFILARFVLGDRPMDRFGAQAAALADAIQRNAWSYLLVLRLVPLFPFFLVNIVPAAVGVRLPVYVLTTLVGIIPGTVVYSLAGAGLGSVFDGDEPFSLGAILTPEIIAALVGLAALALLAIPIRNRFATKR